uniref:Uncharacterized protein n=1 Tax=Terrapene triunguis TaxID=2587831 RepID=A0A674KAK7_9SAUR
MDVPEHERTNQFPCLGNSCCNYQGRYKLTSIEMVNDCPLELRVFFFFFKKRIQFRGVMSVGFLLNGPDDAVIWRGPKKMVCRMIKQFLCDVQWGEIDYLIVDTPPDGAVIITTPQEISLQDVKLPIIGVVENMSGFLSCITCPFFLILPIESQIFPPTTGGTEKMGQNLNISLLGKVLLDPQIGNCDKGQSFLSEIRESPATSSYRNIIQRIQEYCGLHHSQEKLSNQGTE